MILVIMVGILLKINKYEWMICIICFSIVIGGELFNTAIETVVDIVMPHKNEKAKLAKDVAASGGTYINNRSSYNRTNYICS